MNRTFKLTALFVVICMISLLFVSCSKGDGETSGNAQNGVISNSDKSEGGAVSEIISAGADIVSKAEGVVSEIISDILPDKSSETENSASSEESDASESPSTVSFASAGEVSGL